MKFARPIKIVGAVFSVVVLALLVTPLFISADFLKAQLIAQVKKATGRELTIKGNTSLSFLPNIAIVAEDVTLGNPAGFTSPYLVHLDKLETGAALGPLLSKSLEVTGLKLEGASIHLEELTNGAKNWEFTGEKLKQAAKKDAAKSAAEPSPLKNFVLGDVSIRHSDIRYKPAGKPETSLKNINLLLRGVDGNSPLKLSSSVDYKGRQVQADVSVKNSKDFLAGKATATTAKITMPGAAVQFAGDASMDKGFSANGDFEAVSDSLHGTLEWLNGKAPAGGTPNRVRLQGKLAADGPQSLSLNKLDASIDSLGVTGNLNVKTGGWVPVITGALQLAELDLNKLGNGSAAVGGGGNENGKKTGGAWSDDIIDASGLRLVNTDIALKVGKLISGKLQVSDIVTNLNITSGVLRVNLNNAGLYGGVVKGTVAVDGSAVATGINTNLNLTGIQIEPLVVAVSGASKLQGTANLALNLRGSGRSERQIIGSLNGNGNILVADGAVKGINLAQFLRDAKKGFLFSDPARKTDFSELSASYTIANGILTNKDLKLKAPLVNVTGQGTANMPQKTLNYRLSPTLSTNVKGQGGDAAKAGLTIPLNITGPWSSPEVNPDFAGLVQESLKNPEALKENLKNIKEGIRDPGSLAKSLLGSGEKTEAAPATTTTTPATTEAAPAEAAPAPDKKQQKRDAIIQGVGGLLQGLSKPQ